MGGELAVQIGEGAGAARGIGPAQLLYRPPGDFHSDVHVAKRQMGLGLAGEVDTRVQQRWLPGLMW
ncbi:hypothetical protein [Streptomyces spectabilis]|uniref:Uncharacterized protein n=1 Tax=Streptomyces spectabilis TaxID=68270 RepID=A0A7W8B771_STRST|nr:hypothetical protein [Streptomyces spectabilis]MBB5109823.1 hypothetical protein [Streptomyces spectabilis]GGV57924.1 hypothetical protein GCM10010245_91040 [Streptomyces spectabilis]